MIEDDQFLIQENKRIHALGNRNYLDVEVDEEGNLSMLFRKNPKHSTKNQLQSFLHAYSSSSQQLVLIRNNNYFIRETSRLLKSTLEGE